MSMAGLRLMTAADPLEEFNEIQWAALNYMVAEANYGGRVTDGQDLSLPVGTARGADCLLIRENFQSR